MRTLSLRMAKLLLKEAESRLHLIQFRICELKGDAIQGRATFRVPISLEECTADLRIIKYEYDMAMNELEELERELPEKEQALSSEFIFILTSMGVTYEEACLRHVYYKEDE